MIDYYTFDTGNGAVLSAGHCLEGDVPQEKPGTTLVTGQAASPLTHHVVAGELVRFTPAQETLRRKMMPGFRWAGVAQGWVEALNPAVRAQVDRDAQAPTAADQLSAIWAELQAQPGGLKSSAAKAMAQKLGAGK